MKLRVGVVYEALSTTTNSQSDMQESLRQKCAQSFVARRKRARDIKFGEERPHERRPFPQLRILGGVETLTTFSV